LGNLMMSGSPENFTGTSVFNSSVLGPTTTNQPGTTLTGLNSFGGPGNGSFPIGGPAVTPPPLGRGGNTTFGNLGRNVPQARAPFEQDWDFFVTKDFPLAEKYGIQFRADLFNIFNHPNFVIDNLSSGTPAFGVYDNTVGNPRIAQLSLRFHF
jgi:hypothetical protein